MSINQSTPLSCLVPQDPFHKGPMQGRPTNTISKRPDSKDISSRYPMLPPIDENRLKNNQISTVFEPEAWTRQYRPSDNKENYAGPGGSPPPRRYDDSSQADRTNGYRPLYDPRGSGAYGGRHSDPGLSLPAAATNGVRQSHDAGLAAGGGEEEPGGAPVQGGVCAETDGRAAQERLPPRPPGHPPRRG